jgi:PAS domain S-box-containing protein
MDSIAIFSSLRLTILDYTMQIKNAEGMKASASQLSKGYGKNAMDKMRLYCGKLEQYERAMLNNQTLRTVHSSTKTKTTFFISVMFTVLSTLIIFLLLKTEILKRKRMEKELFISREWYASTLTNLGEGVITTDTQHKVTFMNKAAEDLTQWKYTEATGRPIEMVFNLINEYTRKPIESPAIKAIAEKKHIDQSEHILLIRKDGYEANIDVSAVPLLDNTASMIGSVLIFKNITEQLAAKKKLQNMNVNVDNIVRLRIQRLNEEEEENKYGTI